MGQCAGETARHAGGFLGRQPYPLPTSRRSNRPTRWRGETSSNAFLDELEVANEADEQFVAILENFNEFYERRYFRAWSEFARRFDDGWQKFRNRKEWLDELERFVDGDVPYFDFMQRMYGELQPFNNPEGVTFGVELEFFVDMVNFTGEEEGGAGGGGKAAKLGLKVLGKTGKAGKALASAGKKGLKAGKKAKRLTGKGKEELENVLEPAAKTFDDYRKSLVDVAFNAESNSRSYTAVSALFDEAKAPSEGDTSAAAAWQAIDSLQKLTGKPLPGNRTFWDLYTGPLRMAYDYMQQETSCYLQQKWEQDVIGELETVAPNKRGNALIGETGLVWQYVEETAAPFLKPRGARGYVPIDVDGDRVRWSRRFIDFVNQARGGRQIVGAEFSVRINALPTGVNLEAAVAPYATYLQLHCAEEVQTLANFNYSVGRDFVWSLEKCGDVSLSIEIGPVTLLKQYTGRKAFPTFLAELQDGRRVFTTEDFPNQAEQLRIENIKAIDINYEVRNQEQVLKVLDSVPLTPPLDVAPCWDS